MVEWSGLTMTSAARFGRIIAKASAQIVLGVAASTVANRSGG